MNQYLRFSFSLLILFLTFSTHAQQSKIDSLLQVLKTCKEDTNKVLVLNALGWKMRVNKKDNAKEYSDQALELAKKLNFQRGIATAYSNLASISYNQGNYPEALANHFASLKISEAIGNKKAIASTLTNIGIVYGKQGDYPKALDSYFKATEIVNEIHDRHTLAILNGNIAVLYTNQKNFSKALEYCFKALKMAEEAGDKYQIAAGLCNIGRVYEQQSDFSKALDYDFKALKMAEEVGDKFGIAAVNGNIGSIYLSTKKYKESEIYLLKALALSNSIAELNSTKEAELALSTLYSQTGKPQLALEHFKKYITARDTIYNQENTRKTVREQMNYEFDKKQAVAVAEHKSEMEKQTEVAEIKSRKQQIAIWSVIGGLLLVLVFSSLLYSRFRVIRNQKNIIEEQHRDITDNINYAKRIQGAMLTSESYFKKHLKEFFVLYKPKDVVSGDFYWAYQSGNKFLLATADCTGHGVSGAFMSMIGVSKLNETVVEKNILQPNEILNHLRNEVVKALNPEGAIVESKDGMDISLCLYDFDNLILEYAGANNSIYHLSNSILKEYKADKFPVGKYAGDIKSFTNHHIKLQKGDCVYSFTDGFADQFGGEKGKKFKYKQLQELIVSNCSKPMNEQKQILDETLENWKGMLEQVDDILVIGVRVSREEFSRQ